MSELLKRADRLAPAEDLFHSFAYPVVLICLIYSTGLPRGAFSGDCCNRHAVESLRSEICGGCVSPLPLLPEFQQFPWLSLPDVTGLDERPFVIYHSIAHHGLTVGFLLLMHE